MKAHNIVIFLLCIFAGLALMGHFIPGFPSMRAMLTPAQEEVEPADTAAQLSPEELMDQRMKALEASRDSQFMQYHMESPTRIYTPDDDPTYLDPVFDALLQAGRHPVRIMHYGDSQIECDRMTSTIREHFQDMFGGSGAGLTPAVQSIGMATIRVTTTPEDLPHYTFFGPAEMRAQHSGYGPLAQFARVDGEAQFALQATGGKLFPHCNSFRRVSVLAKGEGQFTVTVGETEYNLTCQGDSSAQQLQVYRAVLPSAVSRATIHASGHVDVYGLMADGASGVSMDNIPMRGVSGDLFTRIQAATFTPFFQQQDVALIILQFGGNSVPYLKGGKSISNYVHGIAQQIRYFHRIAPRARILFIGPSDMATAGQEVGEDGLPQYHSYACIPQLVDSLRVTAQQNGAAFWDMYRAMGGRGSMVRWVHSYLAGEDYIHFTPRGARRMSDILYGTLELYYKYYRFRHHLDQEGDSTAFDVPQVEEPQVSRPANVAPADSTAPEVPADEAPVQVEETEEPVATEEPQTPPASQDSTANQ